jgi:hypothetical protein
VKQLSIASALALLLLSDGAAGAATGTASAEIVSAITITNTVGLQFGQIAPSASPGTVTIATSGVRTSTGGVTLAGLATVSAAGFDVTGAPDNTYTITITSSTTITLGGNSMTVDTFESAPDTTGTLSAGGTDVILVGATLHVGANQAAGSYTGTFDVTVAYN